MNAPGVRRREVGLYDYPVGGPENLSPAAEFQDPIYDLSQFPVADPVQGDFCPGLGPRVPPVRLCLSDIVARRGDVGKERTDGTPNP